MTDPHKILKEIEDKRSTFYTKYITKANTRKEKQAISRLTKHLRNQKSLFGITIVLWHRTEIIKYNGRVEPFKYHWQVSASTHEELIAKTGIFEELLIEYLDEPELKSDYD